MSATTPKNFNIATRSDSKSIKVDPRKLRIEEQNHNGRWKPLDEETVRELAMSMIDVGQMQPISIRVVEGQGESRVYAPILGFNRTRAAIMINDDEGLRELAKEKNRLNKDGIFPLDCTIQNINAEAAFVQNVVENARRQNTSAIDDAHNHEILRNMGYKNSDIARIVGLTQARISQLTGLLVLEDRFKEMVHTGEITIQSALKLASLPEGERDSVFEELEAEEAEEALEAQKVEEVTDLEDVEEVEIMPITSTGDTSDDNEPDSPMVEEKEDTEKPKAKPKAKAKAKEIKKPESKKAKLSKKLTEKQRERGMNVKPTLKEIRSFFEGMLSENVNLGEDDVYIKHLFRTILEWLNGDAPEDSVLDAFVDIFEK